MTRLDMNALETLKDTIGGDDEFFAELVETFLEEAPDLLASLRHAVESGNASAARLAAHGLKSNGRDFGATTFANLCKQLEEMGKAGDLRGAEDVLADAEAEFEDVRTELMNLI